MKNVSTENISIKKINKAYNRPNDSDFFADNSNSSFKMQDSKILVRSPNWLGDAVMCTPVIQALKNALPSCSISTLSLPKISQLWEYIPEVDHIIIFENNDRPWNVANKIRKYKFDIGILFPNSPRSAIEMFLAKIPRRIGHSNLIRSIFLTDRVLSSNNLLLPKKTNAKKVRNLLYTPGNFINNNIPESHQVNFYYELIKPLGISARPSAPKFVIPEKDKIEIRQKFGIYSNPQKLWFVLCPWAEFGPAKRWPREKFLSAAIQLNRLTKCGWIIIGTQKDALNAVGFEHQLRYAVQHSSKLSSADHADILNLAGKTSVKELCAILSICDLILTNDCGPMHIAAGVGTRVVAIFASTSPYLTGPLNQNMSLNAILTSSVKCSPCFRSTCPIGYQCMEDISVTKVVEAAMSLLKIPR